MRFQFLVVVFVSNAFIGPGETSLEIATNREREMWQVIEGIIQDVRGAEPLASGQAVRCPGDGTVATRHENQRCGAPVDVGLWEDVKAMYL